MIIAIDGPAASGKGTIAKQVAAIYGLHHLDTGLIYRAVAKAVLDAGHSPDDVHQAMEAAIANTRDLTELVQKSGTDALKIIQERMQESYEEIRGSLEKK